MPYFAAAMYPTIYDAVLDLFGLSIPALKIVMTFGFFVAMAFLAAYQAMTLELKRKEKEGVIKPFMKEIKPVNPLTEYLSNGIIGFIVGWKVVYMIMNFAEVSGDPQSFLLSSKGSVLFGAIGALAFLGLKYYQLKNTPPIEEGAKEIFHPYQMMGNLTIIAAAAGFIGAKVFHHLETFDKFLENPMAALADPFSGLTFYGGLICGGAAVLWYAKKHNVNWKTMLDVGAPAMMLAYGVGRMGCHISGDGDWGEPNFTAKPDWLSWLPDWAWAYDYPNNVLGETLAHPVWPTPMYEVIMALILFAVLWSIRKRFAAPGVLFAIYLIFAGIERFLIEKIRVNPDVLGNFTQAEVISTVFVLLGITGIIVFNKMHKRSGSTLQES